ncbi:MAG: HAMP domain-containing sensor histidine kinase [Planctomycetaceae bacterium]
MKRPLITWLVFAVCVAAVVGVMGGVTAMLLRLEVAEIEAERRAEFERIALWRMDSLMLPLIAQESARPFAAYERPSAVGTDRVSPGTPTDAAGEPPQWSPQPVLHFHVAPDGKVSSPEVPLADVAPLRWTTSIEIDLRRRFVDLRDSIRPAELLASLDQHERRLIYENDGGAIPPVVYPPVAVSEANAPNWSEQVPLDEQFSRRNQLEQQLTIGRAQDRGLRGYGEYQQRLQNTANVNNYRAQASSPAPAIADAPARRRIELEPIRAIWHADRLLLVRRAHVDGDDYLQGCLLDWATIRNGLAAEVGDLFPLARLVPIEADDAGIEPLRMATLPVRLVSGSLAPVEPLGLTPMRFTLGIGWSFLLAAAGAVGMLLWGTLRLSERRAAFVAAVTHELRTPLTTFRLYTGMLVDGVVATEEKRAEYLGTLATEADRLEHLVDNVLAYSRLERTGDAPFREPVDLNALVARLGDSLGGLAARSGMILTVDVPEAPVIVAAEAGAIERIVFNLVDNACKYGARDGDGRILLTVATDEARGRGIVRVRDDGPGIDPASAKRLFRPFSKPVSEAARTAPGVGLGLALSRRLARRMNGELSLDAAESGASFTLTLPAFRAAP